MIELSSLDKDFYKPGEVAKFIGVTTRTIQEYSNQGKLAPIWTVTGRRLFPRETVAQFLDSLGLLHKGASRFDAVYARVSTHKQKNRGDLERQISELTSYAATRNPKNLKIYSDVASGLNDKRKSLHALLKQIESDQVNRVFVTYKDRLTRFGYNYLQLICATHGTEIVVVSNETQSKSAEEELAEDIISVIHSFSGKMYGLRRKIKDAIDA